MKYRKKPIVVEAVQWFKDGDHSAVVPYKPYDGPELSSHWLDCCGQPNDPHGFVELTAGPIVCPGDWIVSDGDRVIKVVRPDTFAETYEPIGGGA